MADNKEKNNIVMYRKKWHLNIGIVLFGIIFFYLIATVLMYLTAHRTTSYEVRIGSILNDTAYTGLAIREETVVNAEQDGYVNYYSTQNIKTKVGSKIGVISGSEIKSPEEKAAEETEGAKELTSDQQNTLGILVQSFAGGFSDEMFADVYSFKDSVQSSISNISSDGKGAALDEAVASGTGTLLQASDDGVVVYHADGFEGMKAEEVEPSMFNKADIVSKEFYNNMQVKKGEPIYKLVSSETWTLVVPISDETAKTLKDKKSVRVRFKKDGERLTAALKLDKKEKKHIAYLTFNSGMIRYANDRFVDIELILEDQTGLKIPKSSVTKKAFFIVPEEYITQGGNSDGDGVLKKVRKGTEFVPATVYYTEENMAYIAPEELKDGDVLLKPNSTETYAVGKTKNLKGVFNINKGYAVFKQIKILCESEDYYIVEAGNSYGLANYDHIALESKGVKEDDIISQ